jgi:predicted RNA binding protein YcfA (HicA-like mRNA interferase family)
MPRLTATAQQVIRAIERQGWQHDHTRGSHHYGQYILERKLVRRRRKGALAVVPEQIELRLSAWSPNTMKVPMQMPFMFVLERGHEATAANPCGTRLSAERT